MDIMSYDRYALRWLNIWKMGKCFTIEEESKLSFRAELQKYSKTVD